MDSDYSDPATALTGVFSPMVAALKMSMAARTESMHRIETRADQQKHKAEAAKNAAVAAKREAEASTRELQVALEAANAAHATESADLRAALSKAEAANATLSADVARLESRLAFVVGRAEESNVNHEAELDRLRSRFDLEVEQSSRASEAADALRASSVSELWEMRSKLSMARVEAAAACMLGSSQSLDLGSSPRYARRRDQTPRPKILAMLSSTRQYTSPTNTKMNWKVNQIHT